MIAKRRWPPDARAQRAMPVELPGLVARPWENNFGHGISFRAIAVAAKQLTPVGANGKG